jgi:hypothetical protein
MSAFGGKADIERTQRCRRLGLIQIMKPAIRLGLRAAHEEAFLDDLAVPDRVKPDLIEVHAFLALWRDLSLKANDELIAVHVGPLTLKLCTSWFAFHLDLFLRPPCAP